jgi:hypothetical protein
MAGLTDTKIAASYDQLLIIDRDGGGNTTNHVTVKDGDGDTTFPITLATDAIMITSTNRLEFGDNASYIHQSADGVLDLVSDTEIEINATTIDINGAVDMSSTLTVGDDINSSGKYHLNEQGRQDHVANTMPSPYYKTDGVNDYILATNNINGFPFSVSWVGRTSADVGSGSYEALFSFTDASDTTQYWGLYNDESDLTIVRRDGGSSIYDDTGFNLTANTLYHVVAVFPSATTAKIYVNGVEVYSGTGLTSVVMDSAFDQFILGVLRTSDNTWPWEGEYHSAQVYNLELSATEVKELYSGASVPFKYKGASQTDLASGWDFTSAWAVSNASIVDANTFRTNASATGSVRKDFGTKGKRVRIRVAGTTPAGCTITVIGVDTLTNHSGSLTGTFDSTFEFLNIDDGYRIQCVNTIASTKDTDITTFTVTEIGAVAEYDGSGVGNVRWDDKSGNDLHGTVSGATVENAPADADSGLTYEEGTWTASLFESTTEITLSNTTMVYVKVGKLVTIAGYFIVNQASIGSGALTIRGLPFAFDSSANVWSNFQIQDQHDDGFNTGGNPVFGYSNYTESLIYIVQNAFGGAGKANVTGDHISDTAQIRISGTYIGA